MDVLENGKRETLSNTFLSFPFLRAVEMSSARLASSSETLIPRIPWVVRVSTSFFRTALLCNHVFQLEWTGTALCLDEGCEIEIRLRGVRVLPSRHSECPPGQGHF